MTRHLILGTGVAGLSALQTIRAADPQAEITLLGDDPHGYYSRPGLAYFLTGELNQSSLFPFSQDDYRGMRFRYLRGLAVRLDTAGHRIELSNGGAVAYDRLLLALGARAVPLPVPGADLQGVLKLDDMEDARRILSMARRGRTAVVIGGGITALELVEGLIVRKMKVIYLLRGDRYWSNVLDPAESTIVEQRLAREGVTLVRQAEAAELIGRRGRVAGIRLKDGRQIGCDLIAYAIGVQPRLELARQAGLEVERGILVDEHLRTSATDVFAAGDVAQIHDPATGRSVLDTLWGLARAQGRLAGLNMTGRQSAYRRSVPFNVTRLAGLTTTIIGMVGTGRGEDLIGIARGDSETWRHLPDAIVAASHHDVNRVRLLVGREQLLGAVVMGAQDLSLPLQDLIGAGANTTSIRERLLMPAAQIGDLVLECWTDWRNRHAA